MKLFHATFEGKGVSDDVLSKQTFGISSDPLMRFAVVLSAIIHDMDHPGEYGHHHLMILLTEFQGFPMFNWLKKELAKANQLPRSIVSIWHGNYS